jgi:hypothetical protein
MDGATAGGGEKAVGWALVNPTLRKKREGCGTRSFGYEK